MMRSIELQRLTIAPLNALSGEIMELGGSRATDADGPVHLRHEAFALVGESPPASSRYRDQKDG